VKSPIFRFRGEGAGAVANQGRESAATSISGDCGTVTQTTGEYTPWEVTGAKRG
jgi:hypothetical protein